MKSWFILLGAALSGAHAAPTSQDCRAILAGESRIISTGSEPALKSHLSAEDLEVISQRGPMNQDLAVRTIGGRGEIYGTRRALERARASLSQRIGHSKATFAPYLTHLAGVVSRIEGVFLDLAVSNWLRASGLGRSSFGIAEIDTILDAPLPCRQTLRLK